MECYEIVDKLVAVAASTKLRGYMWYLSKDLVAMALFSNDVCNEEKAAIVAALKKDLRRVNSKTTTTFQMLALSDFVTHRSLNLFHAMKLDQEFLNSNPSTWAENLEFFYSKSKVSAIRVVNDGCNVGHRL